MKKILSVIFLILFLTLAFANTRGTAEEIPAPIQLTSPAFEGGGEIPAEYTCEGQNISPPLEWGAIPRESQSVVLIMEDTDAPMGIWVHWVLFNLPPTIHSLPEALPALKQLANGEIQGMNSYKTHGYSGPCPPSGSHQYVFKLYALDKPMPEREGVTKSDLEEEMKGHTLAAGELMGTYRKKK